MSPEEKKRKELKRKALETFLSGRKNPGREDQEWEEPRQEPEKKEIEAMEKISGRKKGTITPRQTFRCDEADWKEYIRKCKTEGTTASEDIRKYIKRRIED